MFCDIVEMDDVWEQTAECREMLSRMLLLLPSSACFASDAAVDHNISPNSWRVTVIVANVEHNASFLLLLICCTVTYAVSECFSH